MNHYRRLMLIADPTMQKSSALQRAAAIAKASGASLHILALGGPSIGYRMLDLSAQEQARQGFLQKHTDFLAADSERLQASGITVTSDVVWSDDPLKEILVTARDQQVDLLIKDSQYEPAIKRALITPLDWQLLRECHVPLHFVSFAEHALPRKIVAAVDLSKSDSEIDAVNEQIVAAAQQLAEQCQAKLHLLQAYDVSPAFLAYASGPVGWTAELQEELSGRTHSRMARFGEQHGVAEHRRHIIRGEPTKVIAEFAANQRMDVVVMGTLYLKGLEKIIGSTTEQTLYRVPTSVLAFHPENVPD